MCFCCCLRLHRHQIHLISYGFVSVSLIITGLVFTVFSIFQKDSQIGKVWLAGPVGMVVGLVLCGKVIIDWGPAMQHARQGSIDSTFVEQFQLGLPNGDTKFGMPLPRTPIIMDQKHPSQQYYHYNGDLVPMPPSSLNAGIHANQFTHINQYNALQNRHVEMAHAGSPHVQLNKIAQVRMQNLSPKLQSLKGDQDMGMEGAIDRIVYGHFDSASVSNASSYTALPSELPNDQLQAHAQGMLIANTPAILQQIPRHKRRISAPAQSQNLTLQSLTQPQMQPEFSQSVTMAVAEQECNCMHSSGNRLNASKSPLLVQKIANGGPNYGSIASPSNQLQSQPQQRPSTLSTNKSQQQAQQLLYQGETFVINERSYFI